MILQFHHLHQHLEIWHAAGINSLACPQETKSAGAMSRAWQRLVSVALRPADWRKQQMKLGWSHLPWLTSIALWCPMLETLQRRGQDQLWEITTSLELVSWRSILLQTFPKDLDNKVILGSRPSHRSSQWSSTSRIVLVGTACHHCQSLQYCRKSGLYCRSSLGLRNSLGSGRKPCIMDLNSGHSMSLYIQRWSYVLGCYQIPELCDTARPVQQRLHHWRSILNSHCSVQRGRRETARIACCVGKLWRPILNRLKYGPDR